MPELSLQARTFLGPPGVDVDAFRPRPPAAAIAGLEALRRRLGDMPAEPAGGSSFARDPAEAARALAEVDPERDRLVVFVGKLIGSKGVELLLGAWPQVLAAEPRARLVIVGFGGERERLQELGAGLERVVWTGRLDHAELADLLPAAEALVVPSTFPEAFGMVAAEAAAAGALPVVARHSGLAEVAGTLAQAVPDGIRRMLSFELGPRQVEDLAGCLIGWLGADPGDRAAARAAIVAVTRDQWSWDGVARTVLQAAAGDLGGLPSP
jgi:glycosyltransferase involved in cell wall biosynthesis